MASPFVTAALPVVVARAFRWPEGEGRRVAIAAALCGVAPDLDVLMYAVGVRETELFGFKGFCHSFFAAAILAVLVASFAFRSLGVGSRAWWSVATFLFGATAWHGVLDAMTASDVGVALFAPFDRGRHFLALRILPSTQMGLDEYLGFWGIMTIANEALYVLVPAALAVTYVRARAERERLVWEAVAWVAAVVALRAAWPEAFVASRPRLVTRVGTPDAGDPEDIPHADLPGQHLVTAFDELRGLGLLDRRLEADKHDVWSSSFFPSWFGGEAGRWTDGTASLVWRTVTGTAPPTEAEARAWIDANDPRIATLAPTEKIDLALGRLDFPATRQALLLSHNRPGRPRYWSGRCNGVAEAAMAEREPFRVVDVIGATGARVRFHPNDVKALLAVAYFQTPSMRYIGRFCDTVMFDPGATCSVSPAILVMTIANRLGIAKKPFVVDALVSVAKQYYPVVAAEVRVLRGPYSAADGRASIEPAIQPAVASLVDVDIVMTMSATTLGYAPANVPDPSYGDGSAYQRVGVVPATARYTATLALDATTTLIGGRWTGDPPDGPDSIAVAEGGPDVRPDGALVAADRIPWPLVRELARASAETSPGVPTLDLRTACDGRCR